MSNIYTNAEVIIPKVSGDAGAWLTVQCENSPDYEDFDEELAEDLRENGYDGPPCDDFSIEQDDSAVISIHEAPIEALIMLLQRYLELWAPDGYIGFTYNIEGGGQPTGGGVLVTATEVKYAPTPDDWLDDNVPEGKVKVNE